MWVWKVTAPTISRRKLSRSSVSQSWPMKWTTVSVNHQIPNIGNAYWLPQGVTQRWLSSCSYQLHLSMSVVYWRVSFWSLSLYFFTLQYFSSEYFCVWLPWPAWERQHVLLEQSNQCGSALESAPTEFAATKKRLGQVNWNTWWNTCTHTHTQTHKKETGSSRLKHTLMAQTQLCHQHLQRICWFLVLTKLVLVLVLDSQCRACTIGGSFLATSLA